MGANSVRFLIFLMGLLLACLMGCSADEPLRIGFLGGLSERNSDVGQAGQNGVVLAVEQVNRAGGINGRLVELVSRDDAQTPAVAAQAARELGAAKVTAVIGPFTSGMAFAALPILDQAHVLVISPTVSAMEFYGRDDNLIRINRSTRDNAADYAYFLFARGQRRLAVAFDTRNRVFSESWLTEFRAAFTGLGGVLVAEVAYESRPDADFPGLVTKMRQPGPDGLFFIAGAIDVARLAKESRKQAPGLPLAACEWAASEQLLELGGKMVEGLLIVQNYNRDDESARYRQFREAYFKRFQREPGYSAVSAYDAATVLFQALRQRQDGESVKSAILKHGPYPGLQQSIIFDANGDTQRQAYFTEIRDGRFQLIK